MDFDQHLLAPRLGAGDEALALLARAGRLVGGRGGRRGTVLVQTRLVDHDVLAAAMAGDPGRLSEPELALRRELGLPPASALATLLGPGAAELAGAVDTLVAGITASELAPERWLLRAPGAPDALRRPGRRRAPQGAGERRGRPHRPVSGLH